MPKKIVFLFLLLIMVMMETAVHSQQIKGMVFAGMNLSQVDGDEIYGFTKVGLNTGLGAIVPLGKHFSFTIETLFNQKGSTQKEQYQDTVTNPNTGQDEYWTGEYKLKLDYLEVPVLFHFTDKVIAVGAGFSYGRLVNVKEYEHGLQVETTMLNGGPYDRNDYNVLFDLNFRIHKKISRFRFNVRYAYSISKIRTRDFYDKFYEYTGTRDQYNNLISFKLMYVFNEKPPLADQKNK
jgi:hypothetical protein